MQIFVKNQRQWQAPPLSDETVARFRTAALASSVAPVFAHASYLLNLASPEASVRRRSTAALIDECKRCESLGIAGVVVHPGAALGCSEDDAIGRIAKSLDEVCTAMHGANLRILLENTAGQGTTLGYRLEQLAAMLERVSAPGLFGVCIDTCHLFAAGYDFRSEEGYHRLMDELEHRIGVAQVHCIHANDSQREAASRVDRHEHVGKGKIGRAGFAHFVNDPRWAGKPFILETPKGTDNRGHDFDKRNLRVLRSLIRREE